jgi:hypothetical protein
MKWYDSVLRLSASSVEVRLRNGLQHGRPQWAHNVSCFVDKSPFVEEKFTLPTSRPLNQWPFASRSLTLSRPAVRLRSWLS